jgi:hypothetical protein
LKKEKKKEKEKQLKNGYPKLTFFKVWVLNFKSNKRSGVISDFFFFYLIDILPTSVLWNWYPLFDFIN